jgi:uncharacterized UPF0160 family protein
MCPWKEHTFDIEKEQDKEGLIKFVIFKEARGLWRINTVPPQSHSFDQRVSLLKEWRGLRGEELK